LCDGMVCVSTGIVRIAVVGECAADGDETQAS
jgi:hypothetical protein